jgi:hypothetical protein
MNAKGKSNKPSKRSKDIICFKCRGHGHLSHQCPNNRVMMVKDGKLVSDSENDDSMPPFEDDDEDECIKYLVDGEDLVIRRILNLLVKEDNKEQRENIFHTRCFVNGKICDLIIDGGSCTNIASTTLVEKLALLWKKHSNPSQTHLHQ